MLPFLCYSHSTQTCTARFMIKWLMKDTCSYFQLRNNRFFNASAEMRFRDAQCIPISKSFVILLLHNHILRSTNVPLNGTSFAAFLIFIWGKLVLELICVLFCFCWNGNQCCGVAGHWMSSHDFVIAAWLRCSYHSIWCRDIWYLVRESHHCLMLIAYI